MPLLCGGFDGDFKNPSDQCYKYSSGSKKWKAVGRMSSGRRLHKASVHPELGLIITGGHDGENLLTTVDSTSDGKHFDHSLPDLPVATENHCQVTVDAQTVMVFGGCQQGEGRCPTNSALKLDTKQKKWTSLPNLPKGRFQLICGLVSELGLPRKVVITGGWNRASLSTVDILDLSTMTWSTGKAYGICI